MKIWKQQPHTRCPRCGKEEEDTNHVLQCKAEQANLLWQEEMEKLRIWMRDNNAEPNLAENIITMLQTWREGKQHCPTTTGPRDHQLAMTEQQRIGLRGIISGFYSKRWTAIEDEFLRRKHSRLKGEQWIGKLQRRIWEIAWKMWEQRNRILHEDNHSMSEAEIQAIDREILKEWARGIQHLPHSHKHLFKDTIQHRIKDTPTRKIQWLGSVWAARDRHARISGNREPERLSLALGAFKKWRKRNRRDTVQGGEIMPVPKRRRRT